jgi:hypothetical protein
LPGFALTTINSCIVIYPGRSERAEAEAVRVFQEPVRQARDLAEKRAAELGLKFERFQFRDLRIKSASDMESMGKARKLLGYSTESMTAKYVRSRDGEKVSPVRFRDMLNEKKRSFRKRFLKPVFPVP